ncbi:MAG: hypothetical protein L0229_22715 [Blastocatellia bacterium]|nr:hypothetical protein [Blastocatellia bacterium]
MSTIQDIALKLKIFSANSFTRTQRVAAVLGLIAAATVPFVLLSFGGREANSMPWYIWTLIPLVLLLVLQIGFLMFRRESHDAKDISIKPKYH